MASSDKNLSDSLSSLEQTLKVYFVDKAPFQIPREAKDFIVQYGPWITLILLILMVPAIFAALGLAAFFLPFAQAAGKIDGVNYLSVVLGIIVIVLEAMALPALFKRSKQGWNLLFYASVVSALSNLITLNIGALILGTLIGWYVLFQIRSYYK
jgi:hypothetical protein